MGGGFGGFGGFGGEQEPETPKGRTVVVDLQVTLTDLYLGKVFKARAHMRRMRRMRRAAAATLRRTPRGSPFCVRSALRCWRWPLTAGAHRCARTHTRVQVTRDKGVYRPTKGTRKCNCKTRMATRQIAPGMYQQYPQQTCEDCPAVKLVRTQETLSVEVEPGMRDGTEITFFEQARCSCAAFRAQ
jgi:DnaJ-class molecular chaperone